jgi:carotenoid cleavage dioxygenase-like enzyme
MAAQEPVRRPYLEGNYAPVSTETEVRGLTSRGAIPRDLAGVFVRNSPNPRFPPRARHHWEELYILDAAHVDEEPVARVQIPVRVPTGYHTWWVTADDLAAQRPLDRLS